MSYTPRTTRPNDGDPFWTKTTYGGYNTQILGSPSGWSGSVLANCTGYVHGRWMELGNTSSEYDISSGNANSYFGHSDGYERGQEPRLGAILCLGGGSFGHVAIVEEIFDNGDIMVSESNYGRAVFEYVRRYKADGYKRAGGSVGGFQGFIYHPNITPVEPTYTLTVVNGTATGYTGKNGDRVVIDANIPSGYRFKSWVIRGSGSIDYLDQAHTTFQFGDGDCTIEATFVKIPSIKVVNGKADIYIANAGTVTNIYADMPQGGMVFFKWLQSTNNGTIENQNIMNTRFTFGNGDNTLTAIFRKAPHVKMVYLAPVSLKSRP